MRQDNIPAPKWTFPHNPAPTLRVTNHSKTTDFIPRPVQSRADDVNVHPHQSPQWVQWIVRVSALVVVVMLAGCLAIATTLDPEPAGLGTHHQLGLPPCTIRLLYGMRCPSCGMTTSWAHFVRGQWIASASTNLGGFLLALYALAAIPVGSRIVMTADLPAERTIRQATIALFAIALVTAIDWLFRI